MSWDKYQFVEKVQWSFTPRPRVRRMKSFRNASLESWERRKWPDSVQIVMSRSEQRVTLFHPAAVPSDSVYGDVPFVFPPFGSVLCLVFVINVNSECWVDIRDNIWVESADELFYVHLHFVHIVQIYSMAVLMIMLLQIIGWLWMILSIPYFMTWFSVLQNCVYLFGLPWLVIWC
jgi:hypothetical protein